MKKSNKVADKSVSSEELVIIAAPKIRTAAIKIRGTAPYVQHKFAQKAKMQMLEKHVAGGTGKGKKSPRQEMWNKITSTRNIWTVKAATAYPLRHFVRR